MWADFGPLDVQYEFRIREVGRIVDVAAVFPSGWAVGCEVQLCGTTVEQIEHRSQDYLDAGIEPVWLLGQSADTPRNRAWCAACLGYGYVLDFPDGTEGQAKVKRFPADRPYSTQKDRMKHAAIVRALEIWQPLSADEIARACCLTTCAARRSLAGLLGSMNVNNRANLARGCIEKRGTKWSLAGRGHPRPWYSKVPLSDEAKRRARARAQKHTEGGRE